MNAVEKQVDFYMDLHEGLEARHVFKQPVNKRPRLINIKGRIAEIQYRKKTTEVNPPPYWHPFKPHARPKFGMDEDGNLWIYSGRYVVTTHGIEDLEPNEVRRESLPRDPKELTDLGKLEWIKYISDGERTQTIRFPSNPTISRDERGDLHVLTNTERQMAKRSRRAHRTHEMFESRSARRGKKRRNPGHYSNPSKKSSSKPMEAIKGAAILGAVATGTLLAMNWGLGKYNDSRVTAGNQPISENVLGAVEIGVGLGGAALIGMYWKGSTGAVAAAGVGAGGVVAGLKRLYDNYQMQQLLSGVHTGATGATAGSTAGATSAAGRPLPAGIPTPYNARTRQSCAA